MRGEGLLHLQQVRIIPAYAGNASQLTFAPVWSTDHPRVCGECLTVSGGQLGVVRIIPAYAGNAAMLADLESLRTDHPRVCGECFGV